MYIKKINIDNKQQVADILKYKGNIPYSYEINVETGNSFTLLLDTVKLNLKKDIKIIKSRIVINQI